MSILTSPDANQLISNVRSMLNQPDANNSFWTDDELLQYLNDAIKRYFTIVIEYGQGQFTTTGRLSITGGTETVALPDGSSVYDAIATSTLLPPFFMIKSVAKAVGNGYEMLEYQNNLTAGWSTNASSGTGYMPYYYLRGNSLVLRPSPAASETGSLLVEYVYFPYILLNGGDSLHADIAPTFQELIEMFAVYKAKLKESLVTGANTYSGAVDHVTMLTQQLRDIMSKRSMGPTFVQQWNPEEF